MSTPAVTATGSAAVPATGAATGAAEASPGHTHGEGSTITPEAVVLDFELAGVGSRSLAIVLDLIIQAMALFALSLIAGLLAVGSGVLGFVVLLVGVIAIVIGYPVAMETLNGGRSVGKLAVGTRVVTLEGAPVRFRHAFIRALLGIIDLFISSGSVAVVSALVTRRGQRLGDLVAGTMVIRERTNLGSGWSYPFLPAAQLTQWARAMDTAPLGDDGYQLIRDFLRREDLTDRESGALGAEIEAFVTERLPLWPRPSSVSRTAWLTTIAARAQGSVGPPAAAGSAAAARLARYAQPLSIPSPPSTQPLRLLPPPPPGSGFAGSVPPPPRQGTAATLPPAVTRSGESPVALWLQQKPGQTPPPPTLPSEIRPAGVRPTPPNVGDTSGADGFAAPG